MSFNSLSRHNTEIQENLKLWKGKPVLRKIYKHFYSLIAEQINTNLEGKIVELGSGIGNLKSLIPESIATDIFPNPWIDRVENAYCLSFEDKSVSHIILFDVFHHLQYPGNAMDEFYRVLMDDGRLIIFEPYISLFSFLVYGLLHNEPIAWFKDIKWVAENSFDCTNLDYYAAQGNASRIFFKKKNQQYLDKWKIINKTRIAAFYYLASGGYSKKQLYPESLYKLIFAADKFFSFFPSVWGSRTLIVLNKVK